MSDEVFIEAVNNSKNIHEALSKMGLNAKGAAYTTFKNRCKKLEIDIYHFINDKELRKIISDSDIIYFCENSISRQLVLNRLKLNPSTNANVVWLNSKIESLGINISHWLGRAHLKGKAHNWAKAIPLDDILIKNSSYNWSSNLKKRLLKDNLLEYKCYSCGIIDWQGKDLSLQLEHKNGDHSDNRLNNLELLCPNCHSQTKTFCRAKSSLEEK